MDKPERSLRERFVHLAVPSVISNIMVPLAGLVDTAMLGHLGSIHHLAGVALGAVIFDYIYWSFGFLRMGTTGLTAQASGRGDHSGVALVAFRGFILAVIIGVFLLLLQVPLGDLGFALLRGDSAVRDAGRAYFDARILGAPATLLNFVLIGWFLGLERSRWTLLMSVVANVSNVIFDYVFIYKVGWGAYGAGFATMLSQYLTLIVGVTLFFRLPVLDKFRSVRSQVLDWPAIRQLFSLNRDILIRTFTLQSAFALFLNCGAVLGTTALAANAILMKAVSVASFFIDGYAYAIESLAGVFYGSKRGTELRGVLVLTLRLSITTGLVMALVFLCFPDALFGLLTDHEDVLVAVKAYRWWLLPILGVGAVAYALDGYFIGLAHGRVMRSSMLISFTLGFVPPLVVAWHLESNALLWLAMAVFMLARAVTLGLQVPETLRTDGPPTAGC